MHNLSSQETRRWRDRVTGRLAWWGWAWRTLVWPTLRPRAASQIVTSAVAPSIAAIGAAWVGLTALVCTILLAPGRGLPPDFFIVWAGARELWAGGNPYAVVGPGLRYDYAYPLLYPLPAVLVAAPLAWLPLTWATATFGATAAAALAWIGFRQRPVLFWVVPSIAFLQALQAGQWSPWLVAATLLPIAAPVAAAKPTIAAALWIAYPSWRVPLVAGAFTLITIAVWPWWPHAWLTTLATAPHLAHPPITLLGGPLLLAALWRWRDPSARLLVALACVPQTTHLYEAVPLFLIPQTHRAGATLAILSAVAQWVWMWRGPYETHDVGVQAMGTLMVWLLYLPCLVMVLRRRE